MTINYDTNYEALQLAKEIVDEKLEIFNRAIIDLQEEAKETEMHQHASSPDERVTDLAIFRCAGFKKACQIYSCMGLMFISSLLTNLPTTDLKYLILYA